jgi:photosystem II stability/assembly factor-like uncharacterized protein
LDTTLHAVSFADPATGWVTGDGGLILATRDSGRTWHRQDAGVRIPLKGVQFISPHEGWIVGAGCLIASTSDGGQNWRKQYERSAGVLKSVHFLDRDQGWAVGEPEMVLATTDGGRYWRQKYILPTSQARSKTAFFRSVFFADAHTGWIAGHKQWWGANLELDELDERVLLLGTVDGGQTWNAHEPNSHDMGVLQYQWRR